MEIAGTTIAVVQISAKVLSLCKFYIETAHDAPADLHAIFLRVSTLKTIVESADYLATHSDGASETLEKLEKEAIPRCHGLLTKVVALLPENPVPDGQGRKAWSRMEKADLCRNALMWPFKAKRAAKLLKELDECIAAVNLAFTVETA
jgi:hypothetical protein